jgi:hypothetical protein
MIKPKMLGTDAVPVPLDVIPVDHKVPQIDDRNMQDDDYMRAISAPHGQLRY